MKQQNYSFSKDYLDCIAQAGLFTFSHDEQQIQADDILLGVWKYTSKAGYGDVFWKLLGFEQGGSTLEVFVKQYYNTLNASQVTPGKHTFHLHPVFQKYFKIYSQKGVTDLHFLVLLIASLDNLSPDLIKYLDQSGVDIALMRSRAEKIVDTTLQVKMSPVDFFLMVQKMVKTLDLDMEHMDMFFDTQTLEDIEEIVATDDTDLLDRPGSDESDIQTKDLKDDDKKLTIEYFATDLTNEAKNGFLDPVIGREKEVQQIIYTLMRKTKNNPLLIGEAGVGKTAIVEGLAQKMLVNEVPAKLQNKRLMMLDIGSIVAGTKYRGEFEARLKAIIEEAMDPINNIILFVDEVHTLIGAGNAEGSADAANMLKPLLSRGKIQMIGATTFDEYQKHIEKDPALKRRFQEITVEEPNREDAIAILTGLKERFEDYHGVVIDQQAIDDSVNYSIRYMMNKHLPDKAIDLIDEACARVSTLSQKLDANTEYTSLENKIEKMKVQIEKAIERQDYFKAAELKDKEEEMKKKLKTVRSQNSLPKHLRPQVDSIEVGKVLSDKMGIPLDQVTESEVKQLAHLDTDLKDMVLSQDEAVDAVVKAIRRSRLSPVESNKPIASFLFLGPSGVGKTYLAKLLASEYFADPKALIRVDMSEFMERSSVSKLIGSAPGYVGYEEGGILTEQVRRRPYSVILFDEIEKASPDILNVMLQLLDEGHLKDNKGRWIDFKNTIIIMTSNLGAEEFGVKQVSIGFNNPELSDADTAEMTNEDFGLVKDRIMTTVKSFMAPELINRLSDIIVFRPLSKSVLVSIFKKEFTDFISAWKSRDSIKLPRYNKKKIEKVIDTLYDPQLGARPINRYIHDEIEPELIEQVMKAG